MRLGGSFVASLAVDEALERGLANERETALLRYNQRVAGWLAGTPMRFANNSHNS
jgi:hypothetical protein